MSPIVVTLATFHDAISRDVRLKQSENILDMFTTLPTFHDDISREVRLEHP